MTTTHVTMTWGAVVLLAIGLAFVSLVLVLMVLLALCSVVPVLNFLSLGYLLESSARVARSGRLRDGFIGVRLAGRGVPSRSSSRSRVCER